MWAMVSETENKKLQKALEHLWFELALQRKFCGPEDRHMQERGACLRLLALPGQEYSMWWRSCGLVMMGTTRNSSYDNKKSKIPQQSEIRDRKRWSGQHRCPHKAVYWSNLCTLCELQEQH